MRPQAHPSIFLCYYLCEALFFNLVFVLFRLCITVYSCLLWGRRPQIRSLRTQYQVSLKSRDRGDTAAHRPLPQKSWEADRNASLHDTIGRTVGVRRIKVQKRVVNCVPPIKSTLLQYSFVINPHEARGRPPRPSNFLPRQHLESLVQYETAGEGGNQK